MAPESIVTKRVNASCDVWSFGVVMWEIFAMGELPYKSEPSHLFHYHEKFCITVPCNHLPLSELAPTSSQAFLSALQSGVRLDRPDFCSEEMYGLMAKCWDITPEERPTFRWDHAIRTQVTQRIRQNLNEKNPFQIKQLYHVKTIATFP